MLQRPARIALIAVPVVIAAVALAVMERAALLGWAAERYLAMHGYPDARLDVSEFNLDHITIQSIALGADAPGTGRVEITSYRNENFAIEIDNLHIPVDLGRKSSGAAFPGTLAGVLEYATRPLSLPAVLGAHRPKIRVHDGELVVAGLDGGAVRITADAIVDLTGTELESAIDGRVTSAHSNADFHAETGGAGESRALHVKLAGESDAAKIPWPAAWMPRPASGRATYKLDAALPAPPMPGTVRASPPQTSLTAQLDLNLDSLTAPSRLTNLAGNVNLRIEADKSGVNVNLAAPARIKAASVAIPELAALPLAVPMVKRLTRGLEAALSAVPGQPLLRFAAKDGGWDAAANADVKVALAEGGAALHLTGSGSFDDSLRLREPASLSAQAKAQALPLSIGQVASAGWNFSATVTKDQIKASGPIELRLTKLRAGGLPFDELSYAGACRSNARSFANRHKDQ